MLMNTRMTPQELCPVRVPTQNSLTALLPQQLTRSRGRDNILTIRRTKHVLQELNVHQIDYTDIHLRRPGSFPENLPKVLLTVILH